MPLTTIILDLDDTLFLTQAVAYEMENEAARLLGLPAIDPEVHRRSWGPPIEQALPIRLPGVDASRYPGFIAAHAAMVQEYAAAGKLDQLSAANVEALATLVARGYQLYVVTSRHHGEAAHLLTGRHPFNAYVAAEAIYYRDRLTHHKPDPRVFDAVLAAAGAQTEDCLYVDDTVTDCQAAKAAGLQFVCCLESGLRRREDFTALTPPPDGFIDTFADLPVWLAASPQLV